MTALVLVETMLLLVLAILVAGLLRAYASVLRRLHALDGGASGFRLDPPAVTSPEDWTEAHDVAGQSVTGELAHARMTGVDHDTVLLFLSSACASCATFWDELATPPHLPAHTRLVVVTQGEEFEGRAELAALAAPGLDVLMSTEAWQDYGVPGSPHVVYVDGRTGRVRGEGTGQSWAQIAQLLARASGDPGFVDGRPRARKPSRDIEVEAAVDRELMAAGIMPGDPRLYGPEPPS